MSQDRQGAPNVLIAGLHKSGTTGTYDTVRSALSDLGDYVCFYEPKTPEPLLAVGRYAPARPVLAKLLVHQLEWCAIRYADFDRHVMMVRDPRDVVVSRLLFRPMFGMTSYNIDVRTLDPFVAALKEKEADPTSHSVKGLHDLADRLGISSSGWPALLEQMRNQLRLIDEQGFFVLRYEDFVDGRLGELEKYLGVPLHESATEGTDDGWKSHIARSMKYGEWRRWFLDEDVEFFGGIFAEYMSRFGYEDWERDHDPRIDPATSSGYIAGRTVDRIVERQDRRRGKWTVDSVRTSEELSQIESMAADGRALWAHRSALVYRRSDAFGKDDEQALRWARHAAILGHVPAMTFVSNLLHERWPEDQDTVQEARFWQREYDVLSGTQRTAAKADDGPTPSMESLKADLRRTQRALDRVKSSARYKLGSAIAEAASNPRRIPSAATKIGRLARKRLRRRST